MHSQEHCKVLQNSKIIDSSNKLFTQVKYYLVKVSKSALECELLFIVWV